MKIYLVLISVIFCTFSYTLSQKKELSLKDSIKIDVPETLNQFKKDLIAMHNLESN